MARKKRKQIKSIGNLKSKPTGESNSKPLPHASDSPSSSVSLYSKATKRICSWQAETWISLFIGITGIVLAWHWHGESLVSNDRFLEEQTKSNRYLARIEANWDRKGLEWLSVNYDIYNQKYPGGFTIFFGKEGLPNFIGLPTIPNSLGYFDGFKDVKIKWDESNSDLIMLYINKLKGPQATTASDIGIGISIKSLIGNRKRMPIVLGSDNGLYTWIELADHPSNDFMIVLGRGYDNS